MRFHQKRGTRVLYFVGVGVAGIDSKIFVQESRQASTSVMLIHEKRRGRTTSRGGGCWDDGWGRLRRPWGGVGQTFISPRAEPNQPPACHPERSEGSHSLGRDPSLRSG